jgi:hypothetical protein
MGKYHCRPRPSRILESHPSSSHLPTQTSFYPALPSPSKATHVKESSPQTPPLPPNLALETALVVARVHLGADFALALLEAASREDPAAEARLVWLVSCCNPALRWWEPYGGALLDGVLARLAVVASEHVVGRRVDDGRRGCGECGHDSDDDGGELHGCRRWVECVLVIGVCLGGLVVERMCEKREAEGSVRAVYMRWSARIEKGE